MRNSQEQHKVYNIVKLAALIPDEAIEEDAEVSKSIKEQFNIIMRHKD